MRRAVFFPPFDTQIIISNMSAVVAGKMIQALYSICLEVFCFSAQTSDGAALHDQPSSEKLQRPLE